MCVSSDVFLNLCELYPDTSERLRTMALEKREVTLLFLSQVKKIEMPPRLAGDLATLQSHVFGTEGTIGTIESHNTVAKQFKLEDPNQKG